MRNEKENDMDLMTQRRLWVAILPAAVIIANAFGVPLTEGMLADTGDKLVTAAMSFLALWSYFQPKPV
jgi:uncharacterized membrane protein